MVDLVRRLIYGNPNPVKPLPRKDTRELHELSLLDKQVNLRPPPTVLQALLLPFFPVPKPKDF